MARKKFIRNNSHACAGAYYVEKSGASNIRIVVIFSWPTVNGILLYLSSLLQQIVDHAELCGTPPGMNSTLIQAYNQLQATRKKQMRHEQFRGIASLMDIAADAMLDDEKNIIDLVESLPDGHPPWTCLLKAWYRKHDIYPKTLTKVAAPQKKLLQLMNIKIE
jgi:hypothetical protein